MNKLIYKLTTLFEAGDCTVNWTHDAVRDAPGGELIRVLACGLELLILGLRNLVLALGILFIIIGGIQFITSAGDPEKAATAKKTITWAIIAMVCVVLLWFIILILAKMFGLDNWFGDSEIFIPNPDNLFNY